MVAFFGGVCSQFAYLTFFCVQSRSRCTSFAACMPSAKLARVFANRALACACNANISRFFAFSAPDLSTSAFAPETSTTSMLTFALGSPDSCPEELGCKPAKDGRSCNRADRRSWRHSTSRSHCRHTRLMPRSTIPRQSTTRSLDVLVVTPIAGCTQMGFVRVGRSAVSFRVRSPGAFRWDTGSKR